MERKVGIIFLVVLIIVVFLSAIYFTFFFAYKCDSKECFLGKQEICRKAIYTNAVDGVSWFYKIKGKTKGNCEILTKIVRVSEGSIDQEKLEGKSMDCFLKIGSIDAPEADIANCHGPLKEGLQDLIIKKLHQYVLDNLGEIGESLKVI